MLEGTWTLAKVADNGVATMRAHRQVAWLGGVCLLLSLACARQALSEPRSSVRVRAAACTPLTAQERSWLGPEWDSFLPFVRSCTVRRKNSQTVFLLSVWAIDFEASLPKGAPAARLPKPVVVSTEGRILAHLPAGFPDDPPRSSQVSFFDWVDGFPRRIRVRIKDPAVFGNREAILSWDEASRTYTSTESAQQER